MINVFDKYTTLCFRKKLNIASRPDKRPMCLIFFVPHVNVSIFTVLHVERLLICVFKDTDSEF